MTVLKSDDLINISYGFLLVLDMDFENKRRPEVKVFDHSHRFIVYL